MSLPNNGSLDNKKTAASKPVAVKVSIGKKVFSFTYKELKSPPRLQACRDACTAAKVGDVKVSVTSELPLISEKNRWGVLSFIVSLGTKVKIQFGKSNAYSPNVLDAVLSFVSTKLSLEQKTCVRSAATEAAALLHPNGLELACEHIATTFKTASIKGVNTKDLLRDAKGIVAQMSASQANSTTQPHKTVKSVLPDAPVDGGVTVPSGWDISATGITSTVDGEARRIPAPILIVDRLHDVSRDVEVTEVAWLRDGHWQTTLVDRDVIATSRSIVALAAKGAPITSNNASTAVQFLSEFETANLERFPASISTSQMGWHTVNGLDDFVWGKYLITAESILDPDAKGEAGDLTCQTCSIRFRGADDGNDQVASGYHAAGTYEGWLEAVSPIAAYPCVKLALYAALTAPLLHCIGAPNFIVDLAGETSNGKTTALQVAASVWGNPNFSASGVGAAMATWDGTAVSRERIPATLKNVPFILDDTTHIRNPDDVAKTIYEFMQGRSRDRGTTKGLARQLTWQTVMLTNGEKPATAFTSDGGTKARVITHWGSPFGGQSDAVRALVERLKVGIFDNYGHAGPRFIQGLLSHFEDRQQWRQWHQEEKESFAARAPDNPIAGRLASHFAAISVAANFAHSFLDLPWEFEDPIEPLFDMFTTEAGEADRPAAALAYLYGWAAGNEARFSTPYRDQNDPPSQGWAGVWHRGPSGGNSNQGSISSSTDTWLWIGFTVKVVQDVLKEGGFDFESCLRAWQTRGWLVVTRRRNGRNCTRKKARMGRTENVWLIAVRRSAIMSVAHR